MRRLAIQPVSKARTNKFYIYRQCTYIVYILVSIRWSRFCYTFVTNGVGTTFLPEHIISLTLLIGIDVTQYLVYTLSSGVSIIYFPLVLFPFCYCIVCSYSIYGFLLSIWFYDF